VNEVMGLTGEKNRGRAVNKAMEEFVRSKKIEKLIALAGHLDIEDNWEEWEEQELAAEAEHLKRWSSDDNR
jgi:hypothetical protein